MNGKIPLNERIVLEILNAKAVDIRDIDNGEKPFLYASGNWGPGYVSVKNLVGRKAIIKLLAQNLAIKISDKAPNLDFIAGNVTGGVIPAWLLSEYLGAILGRTVPFVYIRETRKKGGQKELITGIKDNPEIPSGANGVVVEELVNFAQTTCNGAEALREAGYEVTNAACILFYDNPEAIKSLQTAKIEMVYLITLPQLLEVAEKHKTHSVKAINSYRDFLKDPLGWQAKRGLEPVKEGGTK
ncbi:MAG: phosphoribosyltransferase family protein [Patescibacteria group bacterium]